MPDLCDLLADALDGFIAGQRTGGPQVVEGDVESLASLFGATPREQNPRMAQAIAGTDDKRSRAYKAALRSIQRYRAGAGKQRRAPSALRLRVIRSRLALRRLGAIIVGTIRVSDDTRTRKVQAVLGARSTRAVIGAHERGDDDAACSAFESGFVAAYSGVPLNFVDVQSLDLFNGDA